MMKIQTKQGEILIEAEYQSKERAVMDGYGYALTAEGYGEVYFKPLDDGGCRCTYALITGYC